MLSFLAVEGTSITPIVSFQLSIEIASYGRRDGNAPNSFVDFGATYIVCSFIPFFFPYTFFLTSLSLIIYFLTYLLLPE